MRRSLFVAAAFLMSTSPVLASGPSETCLFDEPDTFWSLARGTVHASWADALTAAGVEVTAGARPCSGEAACLVQVGAGQDLFVVGATKVVRFAAAVPGPGELPMHHWTLSSAAGRWVTVTQASQLDAGEPEEPGLEAHPSIDLVHRLVDTHTGRAALVASETLPSHALPQDPGVVIEGDRFRLAFGSSPERPLADAQRCVGGADAQPAALAARYVALGRKLTKDQPDTATSAFSQAIDLDQSVAEAWSGRGYARLQSYIAARKKDTTAIGYHDARTDFEAAVARSSDPKFLAMVWFNLGETHRLSCESFLPQYQREPLGLAVAAYEKSLGYADREPVRKALAQTKAVLAALPE